MTYNRTLDIIVTSLMLGCNSSEDYKICVGKEAMGLALMCTSFLLCHYHPTYLPCLFYCP
jgi:hypothetical protein